MKLPSPIPVDLAEMIAHISSHIEAAERDLHCVLRQVVLAEREPAHHVDREAPPGTHDPLT